MMSKPFSRRPDDPIENLILHPSGPGDWAQVSNLALKGAARVLDLLRDGSAEEGWYSLNQWKGRMFLHEEMLATWLDAADQASPGLSSRMAAIDALELEYRIAGEEYPSVQKADASQNEVGTKRVSLTRDELWAQMGVLKRRFEPEIMAVGRSLRWHPSGVVPTPTPDEFCSLLRPDEVYLDVVWGDDGVAVIRLDEYGITAHLVPSALADDWGEDASRADTRRRNGAPWYPNAQLGAQLFGPLIESARCVLLSPHDDIFSRAVQMPMHLYFPASTPLGVVPGATFLVRKRTSEEFRSFPDGSYLGIADQGGGELPGSAAAANWIHDRYFESDVHPAIDSDIPAAVAKPRTVRLLHVGSHARPDALFLDGRWVTKSALLKWNVNAPVVLMTGCNLGLIDNSSPANGFSGAVRALAGATHAEALIVSMEKVPEAASLLFSDFVIAALFGREPALGWGGNTAPSGPLTAGEAVAWAKTRMEGLTSEDLARDESGIVRLAMSFVNEAAGDLDQILRLELLPWWYVLGDPRASCMIEARERNVAILAPFVVEDEDEDEDDPPPPSRRTTRLANGENVFFYDSQTFPHGELGAMDIMEATKAPTILRTTEGWFSCWIDGDPGGRNETLEDAMAEMLQLLYPGVHLATSPTEVPPRADPVVRGIRAARHKDIEDLATTTLDLSDDQIVMINSNACFYTEEPDDSRRFWSADRLFPISIAMFGSRPFYDFGNLERLFLNWGDVDKTVRCRHLRIFARGDPAAADFIWDGRDFNRFLKARDLQINGSRVIGEPGSQFEVQTYSWRNYQGVHRQALCWLRNDEEFWEIDWNPETVHIDPILNSWRWLDDDFYRKLAIEPRILDSRSKVDLDAIAEFRQPPS
jgi:hypothetical protein